MGDLRPRPRRLVRGRQRVPAGRCRPPATARTSSSTASTRSSRSQTVNVAGHPPGLLLLLHLTGITTPQGLAALCIAARGRGRAADVCARARRGAPGGPRARRRAAGRGLPRAAAVRRHVGRRRLRRAGDGRSGAAGPPRRRPRRRLRARSRSRPSSAGPCSPSRPSPRSWRPCARASAPRSSLAAGCARGGRRLRRRARAGLRVRPGRPPCARPSACTATRSARCGRTGSTSWARPSPSRSCSGCRRPRGGWPRGARRAPPALAGLAVVAIAAAARLHQGRDRAHLAARSSRSPAPARPRCCRPGACAPSSGC